MMLVDQVDIVIFVKVDKHDVQVWAQPATEDTVAANKVAPIPAPVLDCDTSLTKTCAYCV